MAKPELAEAVSQGDLEAIRALLEAGADVRYVRPQGYTVMIDVMHGRPIQHDGELLTILRLLIAHGADLDAVSDYGESALGVASRVGRFDAVALLLEAGADPGPLRWTGLHQAVALGSEADVERCLAADGERDLAARDGWDRTPLLLSLHVGETGKAERLLEAGGSLADRGRCGMTPLMYPIERDATAMLRWLLDRGVDPNATDEFGGTALLAAAAGGAGGCVRVLLEAGADPKKASPTGSPMESASSLAVARMLAEAGADFSEINEEVRDELTGRRRSESIDCTREDYLEAKHRRFGRANPERMNLPFWRAMVASGQSAYAARERFDDGESEGAVWCYQRFGKSFTELPDGRVVEIAGEHEDYYDPDFCIYNDVVVHHGDGTFDIYGYPEEVFPPTDFHTATLVDGFIYIIGSLGYRDRRRLGTTPVYRLAIATLAIEPVATRGQAPGWIGSHQARLVGGHRIEVSGGKVCARKGRKKETYEDQHGRYVLDLGTMSWSKVPG